MSDIKTTVTAANADVANNAVATSPKTSTPTDRKKYTGLTFRRRFTKAGVDPYASVEWELRTAAITDAKGNDIFRQENVESPKDWSMTAFNIVPSKYLHGRLNSP